MHHLLQLIVQVAVILVAARVVGAVFRRLRQPQVVGEMAAGILLGPSLLGWLAPEVYERLFPAASLGHLGTLSQLGLLLFMFLVGLEFDPRLIRGRGHAAVVTSHVSIIVPFFLGSLLALYLYPRLSDASVSFTGFALFMGAAMSITAFPVLARILTERNLLGTRVGAITIACAAVDDVTAWVILAGVVAIVRSGTTETPLWLTLLGTASYIAIMVLVVRRGLGLLEAYHQRRGKLTQDIVAITFLLLLASAFATEWLGIHALFGCFALGAVMPKERSFVHGLSEKLEDVTVVLLLPIFFAFTGLRTSIGLVSGGEMWFYAGLVLLVATAGKFGGSSIAARITGLSWREAGALGILMNTRGLMELVILTIGLELGVISDALFAMMVLMALTTTAMTTPILEWIYPERLLRGQPTADEAQGEHRVVLPVALPSSGPGLLHAALALAPEGCAQRIYALHLDRTSENSLTHVDPERVPEEDHALQPVLAVARAKDLDVVPLSFASRSVARDVLEVVKAKGADLVVMGWHKPVVGRSILSGTVAAVLRSASADVAVLVERSPAPWRRILVPYRNSAEDRGALEMARRIAAGGAAEVTILHVVAPERAIGDGTLTGQWSEERFPDGVRLKLVPSEEPLRVAVEEAKGDYDLIVVGVSPAWGTIPTPFGHRHEELARATSASLLVVRARALEQAQSVAKAPASVTRRARAVRSDRRSRAG